MAQPFLGEIRVFGFNYAPKNWALCNGQVLSISQNQALYSLLGTRFGGDGRTNFMLPDLRGRIPVHFNNVHPIGQKFGYEAVSLTVNQIPKHTHNLHATSAWGNSEDPNGKSLGKPAFGDGESREAKQMYRGQFDIVSLNPSSIGTVGGSQAHTNMQPSLVLNFCIALKGTFPPRN